jgi:tape measure domain-containing protein
VASNDVIGALYYKVVLDPRGFARGAATVKSEQDLIARAIKSSVSDFAKLQAELDAIGDRAVKASEQERKILGDYQKQIISQMEGIVDKEKELEKIAEENKRAEAEKEVLANLQKVLDKKKEAKKIAQDLADVQISEEKRASKEALKAEKHRIAEEKKLEKELADYRRQRHARRFQDLSRYFTSFGRFKVLLSRMPELIEGVNGGLSKMAGNLAMAAGLPLEFQGLVRSLGAIGVPILAAGSALAVYIKFMTVAIKKADEFRRQVIKLMPLMNDNAKATGELMDNIMSLAARTGFATETMFNLSEALLNLGMTARQALGVGELLAGLAGGDEQRLKSIAKAYSDVMMKGRLMGQEALQFANAGIPIYKALAESMGRTTAEVRQMMEDGLISAEEMGKALASFGLSRDVSGQLAENMRTVSGQISRILTLIDQMFIKIGLGKDTELAAWLKSFGDAIEYIGQINLGIELLGTNIFTYLTNPMQAFLDMVAHGINSMSKLRDDDREAEMMAELKAKEEQAKAERDAMQAQEDAFKTAQKQMNDQARMSEQERENMEKRKEFEEWLAQQNVNEEQKEYLRLQYEIIKAKEDYIEKEKERIELERKAAEDAVKQDAENRKRAMAQAKAGAGPSFGAGSTGEFQFLRDLILNRREKNEELKIMKDQKAALDEIAQNTQDQLDALDDLQVGGETTGVVGVGGP